MWTRTVPGTLLETRASDRSESWPGSPRKVSQLLRKDFRISPVGVEVKSSAGLMRQQLVHVPLFYTGLTSQRASSQELTRGATAATYKAQVCSLFADSSNSFVIWICFCTAYIGNVLALALLGIGE